MLSSSLLMMLSWAFERMRIWCFTVLEPDAFLLIFSWTLFVSTNFNPLLWRSLSLKLLRSMKRPNVCSRKVCCIHCAVFLSKSSEDLFPCISCLHSLAVNLKQNSTHNHIHSSDVRSKSLLTVLLQWHMPHRIEKEDPSLTSSEHWCFHRWSCQSPFLH